MALSKPSNCSGGRYKLLILRHLLYEDRPVRFGELRRALPGVGAKTLTRNLRELEAAHLLTRTIYAEVPPRVEYALTSSGQTLMPVFLAMKNWGEAHLSLGMTGPLTGHLMQV